MYVIYSLEDPRDNATRYVGITNDVYQRFCEHIRCDGSNFRKDAWIQELKATNSMVRMPTLEQVKTVAEARVREAYWIHHYLHLGADLLNNHILTPLHLKAKAAQIHTLKAMRDAEIAALALSTSKDVAVRELRELNWGKQAIIEKVWGVTKGASPRYKAAEAEYEQIMSQLEGVET